MEKQQQIIKRGFSRLAKDLSGSLLIPFANAVGVIGADISLEDNKYIHETNEEARKMRDGFIGGVIYLFGGRHVENYFTRRFMDSVNFV